MTNEEIDNLAYQIYAEDVLPKVESGKDLRIQDLITRRLVQLLDAQVVVKPRVWRGGWTKADHWCWLTDEWHYYGNANISDGDIFLPGTAPKPTSPPPPVEELSECLVVDW